MRPRLRTRAVPFTWPSVIGRRRLALISCPIASLPSSFTPIPGARPRRATRPASASRRRARARRAGGSRSVTGMRPAHDAVVARSSMPSSDYRALRCMVDLGAALSARLAAESACRGSGSRPGRRAPSAPAAPRRPASPTSRGIHGSVVAADRVVVGDRAAGRHDRVAGRRLDGLPLLAAPRPPPARARNVKYSDAPSGTGARCGTSTRPGVPRPRAHRGSRSRTAAWRPIRPDHGVAVSSVSTITPWSSSASRRYGPS